MPEDQEEEVFVGSIDQGTTSSRFLIFNRKGEPVASHQVEFKQIYPQSGWHEHDPDELVSSVESCIDEACAQFESKGYSTSSIRCVGITNQRETTLLWERSSGKPLHNAIVWTDTRSAAIVHRLKQQEGADELLRLCGLPLSTYPSVTKILWCLENVRGVKECYERGDLAFGTVDTWLAYRLNGGRDGANVFVTDATNASRTMLMDIHSLSYSSTLLDFFGLSRSQIHLPEIVPSSCATSFGALASTTLAGVPITGCLGDQSAALVGHRAFSPGLAKNTYGTGCFLLYNVGPRPVISSHGLLATVAYHFPDSSSSGSAAPIYALEGSIAVAGSALTFLQKNLNLIPSPASVDALASKVPTSAGAVFVTAFSGLFAPYWLDSARGTLFGLTAYTTAAHVARATLESVCFQTRAILESMQADSGEALAELAVDGGMCASDVTMQIQADVAGVPVRRPRMRETTSLGAGIAAGLAGARVWSSLEEVKEMVGGDSVGGNSVGGGQEEQGGRMFRPEIDDKEREKMFRLWQRAVRMCEGWIETEDPQAEAEPASGADGKEQGESGKRKRSLGDEK